MLTGKENILGKNLRELRQARGLKQGDVADALGVPSPTYSSWERGRTEPSIDGLLRLARYFDVSVDRLLRFESRALKVGSWYPLGKNAKFHPINYQRGTYTLIYPLVFNCLYFFNVHERRFHVELIDSWRVDRSSPSYIFYLRSDVSFHNGDPLELEDVKYSYRLFLDQRRFFRKFVDYVEIRKEEYAIELRLKPGKWLELDDLPAPYIIPRSYGDDDECFEGTGPFKLTDEQQNRLREGLKQPVILESNSAYFGKMPSIQTVEFQRFDDLEKLEDSLKRGDVNLVVNFALDESDKFDVEYGSGTVPFYLVLNHEVFQDENLRKAIDFALDRERIINATGIKDAELLLSQHLYLVLREPPPPDDGNNYDPAEAKKCWEAAKASLSERGITDLTLRIGSSNISKVYSPDDHSVELDPATSKAIDEIIKQLGEVGINAEQERNLDRTHALVEVIGFPTPVVIYQHLHSSEQPRRLWKYKNVYVDHLLDNIEGMDTYRQIQEILTAERLFIPLFRRGVPITHARDLDTKSKLRTSNVLYGPDVVHWEFK